MRYKKLFYLLVSIGTIFLLHNSLAIQWNSQVVYDEINQSTINQTLWQNSTICAGIPSATGENPIYLFVNVSQSGVTASCTQTDNFVTSLALPDLNTLSNLTFFSFERANSTAGTGCSGCEIDAQVNVFNNQIKQVSCTPNTQCDSTDSSEWTFLRNTNGSYNYYDDGAFSGVITSTASSKNLTVSFNRIKSGGGTANLLAESRIYYVYLMYNNNTMNVTQAISPVRIGNFYGIGENVNFNLTANTSINILKNATLFVDGILNETRTFSGGANSTLFVKKYPSYANHNYSILTCDSDSNCKSTETGTFTVVSFVENSQSYNNNTISGTTEQFLINLTYNSTLFPSVSASLMYNNTQYSSTKIGSGDNFIFNSTITIPTVSAVTVEPFYWTFTFTDTNSSAFFFNSTNHTQTNSPLGVDNCTANSIKVFNMSLHDEETRNFLNGTIEALLTFYAPGTTTVIGYFNNSFGYTAGKGNAQICVSNGTAFKLDYALKYYVNASNNNTYFQELKYGQNIQFTNNTGIQNIDLYDLNQSQGSVCAKSFYDASLNPLTGIVVNIQRQYLPINQYLSVESPLTDASGTVALHLVPNTQPYNFVLTKDNAIIGTFNNQLVITCGDSLNLINGGDTATDYSTFGDYNLLYTLNRTLRTLTLSFSSISGTSHLLSMQTISNNGYGNTTICTNSASASSGTFTCNIPTTYGNSTFYTTLISDGQYIGTSTFSLSPSASEIFGGTRVVLGILMYTSLTLVMTQFPFLIVVGIILGMGFAAALFIVDGTWISGGAIFVWFLAIGIIIIIKVARDNE